MQVTKASMTRSKKFSDRTVVAFPADTFEAITQLSEADEERTAFIRDAVEFQISLRSLAEYPDLKAHLLANESIGDFCLKAIMRATGQRKAALAGDVVLKTAPSVTDRDG
jgi:hypothetical protein